MVFPHRHAWLPALVLAMLGAGCAATTVNPPDHVGPDDGATEVDGEVESGADADVDADADAPDEGGGDTPLCSDPSDCDGALCVDGFCCDSACAGECEACNVPGREGTCAPIPYNEDPDEECLAELPAACGYTGFCNGARACAMYGEETACNDDDPCTTGDACTGTGECHGTTPAACNPGPADQCCDGACDAASGCYTVAGTCVETCEANRLVVGRTCVGCGAAGAEGVCTGGATHACDASNHAPCQEVSCGGTTYRCTTQDSTWAWRTGVLCDDADACTFNDACFGGACSGTRFACIGEACMSRTCDGAGACDESAAPAGTSCGTTTCPVDNCTGMTWHDYPANCTSTCDGAGGCDTCTCVRSDTTCTVGPTNVCCNAACSDTGGCYTVPGSCGGGDVCSNPNVLNVGSVCAGCSAAGANGTCGGGGTFTCNGASHIDCQNVSCGGTAYWCTRVGGVWQWRTTNSCDDGDACSWGDTCGASGCVGTAVTCSSNSCVTRTCNGTPACIEVFRPAATPCGTSGCTADYCAPGAFHDFSGSCTNTCDGAGTCVPCTCPEIVTSCTVGPTNQCCAAACDPSSGCGTTPGSCTDLCTDPNTVTTGRGCSACGPNGANGTCGGGTPWDCRAASYVPCRTVTCGGATYYCTNQGGTVRWRAGDSRCDDANLCTYNDVCSGTTCAGTSLLCTPTPPCINRTCNGTTSCTVTYNPGVTCNDGDPCTSGETCNASGGCTGGTSAAICPDGACNCGETRCTCEADCGVHCGNAVCDCGETSATCASDCPFCPSGLSLATWAGGPDGWVWDDLWRRDSSGYMVAGSGLSHSSNYTENLTYASNVDLSGCASATLRFLVRLSDDAGWESESADDRNQRLYVECSGNAGGSWTPLTPNPWPANQSACSTSYCDGRYGLNRSFPWTSQAIDLPPACRTNQARFRFRATGTNIWDLMDPGWYVDTVSLN